MLKKLKKLCSIIKYYFRDSDNLLLYLMELKAYECLDGCCKLEIRSTEELEDLIFHIRTYLEIPLALVELKYPEFKDRDMKELLKKYKKKKLALKEAKRYSQYLVDVEKQRALERDFIFEHAKVLSFGFEF